MGDMFAAAVILLIASLILGFSASVSGFLVLLILGILAFWGIRSIMNH